MLIIKTTMIAIFAVIAVIGVQQTAQATSDDYTVENTVVKVVLKGVDSTTGNLQVQVMPQDGDNKMRTVNLFDEGYAGNVEIRDFIFNTDELDNGDNVNVCVYALDNGNVFTCDNEVVKHNIAKISLQIPGVPEQSSNGPTQYEDEDEDERESYVQQGDDSINTDKDQGSGIGVSFGDNSDHNTVNVDQRSTFADVIRDIVPIAKEGAHVAKDTAAQLLN